MAKLPCKLACKRSTIKYQQASVTYPKQHQHYRSGRARRAAQGQPWIFRDIEHFLRTGSRLDAPSVSEIKEIVLAHLQELYGFYGEYSGCRIARKHIAWYTTGIPNSNAFRQAMYGEESTAGQFRVVEDFLHTHQ